MKQVNKILLLLVLFVLAPATAWAGDPPPRDDASFPKPYVSVDKGMEDTGLVGFPYMNSKKDHSFSILWMLNRSN